MPNLRIVYDNAADRAATLTASSTAGSMSASNMLTDIKGQAHRSVGTSVTYTLTWSSFQKIGAVILPATNLTNTATIQVKLYKDAAGTQLVANSGTLVANPNAKYNKALWPEGLNVNTFSYGALTKTYVWFDQQPLVRRCEITLVDTNNAAGYIDCSRIVCGEFWSPTYNFERGVTVETRDETRSSRSESGNLIADRKTVFEQLRFKYSVLTEADRSTLQNIINEVGTYKNIVVSLLPTESNGLDFLIYGKRTNSPISVDFYRYYGHNMDIVGW